MTKQLCLIHANCQGDPLAELLEAHPDFGRRFEIRNYVNYARQIIPEEDLRECGLLLYQRIGEKWGDLSSGAVLSRLNPAAKTLCIPNMLFTGYWPFWRMAPNFDFSDFFLDDLLARGLTKKEILHIFLFTDPGRYYDLDELFARSLAVEREKEAFWDVKAVDMILERHQTERLFNTVNHPGPRLCLHVAEEVLRLLGFSPLPESARRAFADPYPEFVLPTHPAVARRRGLSFIGQGERYPVFGKLMDFTEYANCYLECKLAGEEDFISFLRLRAKLS